MVRGLKHVREGNVNLQSFAKIMRLTTNFTGKYHFLCMWKWIILGLKAEKQLRNKNYTVDWALGCQPGDNGHVTH